MQCIPQIRFPYIPSILAIYDAFHFLSLHIHPSIISMLLFPPIHLSQVVLCKNGIVIQRNRERKALITLTGFRKSKIKSKFANAEGNAYADDRNHVISFDWIHVKDVVLLICTNWGTNCSTYESSDFYISGSKIQCIPIPYCWYCCGLVYGLWICGVGVTGQRGTWWWYPFISLPLPPVKYSPSGVIGGVM